MVALFCATNLLNNRESQTEMSPAQNSTTAHHGTAAALVVDQDVRSSGSNRRAA